MYICVYVQNVYRHYSVYVYTHASIPLDRVILHTMPEQVAYSPPVKATGIKQYIIRKIMINCNDALISAFYWSRFLLDPLDGG